MRFPNLQVVLRDLGGILLVFGVVMLVPAIVAFVTDDFHAFECFLITAAGTCALGEILSFVFRRAYETELKHAMVCAALTWLIVSAISACIFVFAGGFSVIDAFFEAMSGWTGTGLTVVSHPSSLTKALQFWRSFMQWLGGVGVIVLMVSILGRRPGTGAYALYRAEAREEKIKPSVISTVQTIWWIYLLFTIIGVILLKVAGMRFWEALNHAMTGIGTGGFTVVDKSIAYYNNLHIEIALIPIMLAGAISFMVHYKVITGILPFKRKGEARAYFADIQCRTFLIIIVILVIVLSVMNLSYYKSIEESLRFSSFQLISAITCTGFQTATNLHAWHEGAQILLAFAMIVGGCAGSTAGGVKMWRLVIVYKGISDAIRRTFVPRRAVISHKIGERVLEDEMMNRIVSEAAMIILIWIFFIFIGVIVLSFVVPPQYTLSDIIFEVCSAQGNVGLSTGITSTSLHPIGKIMLIFNMYVGRLEIIPVLMLVRSLIKGFRPM